MSNKKLKVGFAMGGGVSLGTFSGAALSEAIKQLVLYGGYTESGQFKRYSKIEIDVFSGASAGMMSLAIMLRGLTDQSDAEREAAVKSLEADSELGKAFVENLRKNEPGRYEQLVVAQVVQNLQASIWIDQINIDRLLGVFEDKIADLTYEPGILAREALTRIARSNFKFEESSLASFPRRQILSERVLVAATLANLTPLKSDARQKNDPAYVALEDAKTSYSHRELRVFDLHFRPLAPGEIDDDPDTYPGKWIRYHMGAKTNHYFGDIRDKNAWSKIVATGIACGSFPFAFQPAVLTRHDFEYGVRKNAEGKMEYADWPEELHGKDCYPFTYIDGGTFNNEPVREAYRLASFQDAGETEEFDRVIIFVDPSIAGGKINFRIPIHKEYYQRGRPTFFPDIVGNNIERSTSTDRLMGHVGTLFGAIFNEARVNEGDKIHRAIEMFHESKEYHQILLKLIDAGTLDDAAIIAIRDFCNKILGTVRMNELLPPGAVTLSEELTRVNRTMDHKLQSGDVNNLVAGKLDQVSAGGKKVLTEAMIMLLVDLMMGLGGKVKDSTTVAIAPVKPSGSDFKPVFLPGGYIEAFAGFTSKVPNYYEAELAKYCAQVFMKKGNLIGGTLAKEFSYREFSTGEQEKFESEFRSKLPAIEARMSKLLTDTRVLNIGNMIDKAIMKAISGKINDALEAFKFINKKTTTYLLRIPIEENDYQINSPEQGGDLDAVEIDSKFFLMTELDYVQVDDQPGKWEGEHVEDGALMIDRNGFLGKKHDRKWCRIILPPSSVLQEADLWPNPILELKDMITSSSKGETFSNWQAITPGVAPLEEGLL